jgi:hypothetical protein
MRQIIDDLAVYNPTGHLRLKLVAGIERPCAPRECCTGNNKFEQKGSCIYAPKGYAADSIIYATVR